MIDAIEYARTNKVPLLGICLGMQLITIEYARNVCGIKDANSLEFDELCKNPVINLMSDQSLEDMGGTQRLGDYECQLNSGTHAARLYGKELIKDLQNKYGNQIEILAGSGINASNARKMMEDTGIYQVHSSCKDWINDPTTKTHEVSYAYAPSPHENDYDVVSKELVEKIVKSI